VYLGTDAGAGAGVLAAGAAAESPLEGAGELDGGAAPESPPDSLFEDLGAELPYPSAYQPPPLKAMAGAEMTRSSGPPQCGQMVISGSENFWIFSVCLLHCVHSYS
jgi:hypothetical protein